MIDNVITLMVQVMVVVILLVKVGIVMGIRKGNCNMHDSGVWAKPYR